MSLEHKLHHSYPDSGKDPHSPRHFTLKQQINVTDNSKPTSPFHIPKDFDEAHPEIYNFDDKLESFLIQHSTQGIYILHGISLILFGPIGLLLSLVMFKGWIKCGGATFVGNFITHGIGGLVQYKHPDHLNRNNGQAVNFMPIGFLLAGEEFHSNHHCDPTSAKFSYRWWELDMGYVYALIFEKLGLLKIKRRSPK